MATLNTDYIIGLKREVVTALEPMFRDQLPIPELQNRVYVGLEYPFTQARYPAIYITYNQSQLRSGGVGHTEIVTSPDGTPAQIKHWYFVGTINFNIMTLSPKERDELASVLVNALAFADTDSFWQTFKNRVMDSSYVALQYLQEVIHPGGEQIGQTPWESETDLVFGTSYSIDLFGEFYSNIYTGDLVQWEHVSVHPYTPTSGAPLW